MTIEKELFGTLSTGREVYQYTLRNNRGMEVQLINFGAIITSIKLPDKANNPGDVVLGFDNLDDYLGKHPYFGALVGRVCNRIGNARFEMDGKVFHISANHGTNHIHGGTRGFDKQIWTAHTEKTPDDVTVRMGYESKDGEEGYPGNLMVELEYWLNDENELGVQCRAKTDKPTHVNLTNHSYFNLNNCEGTIYDHELFIDSDRYTELNSESIPTGKILTVGGTPYDFRIAKAIGAEIDKLDMGYDINYVLDMKQRELTRVAAVFDPASGRSMEVLTTLPGIQLYTSNYIEDIPGKNGINYKKHCALCLETQYFPDSANQPSFPSTVLLPGDEYNALTVYRFGK